MNKMCKDVLIKSIRSIKSVMDNTRTKWFVGFGVMLGLLRDGTPPDDNDIDICVYYEQYNFKSIKAAFSIMGYAMDKVVYPDKGDVPLYSHFSHPIFPDMCMFAWYLHNGIRYHTYYYYNEKNQRLRKYRFKGIDASFIENTVMIPIDPKRVIPGGDIVFPTKYGSCLDVWYPNWLERRKEQSHSNHIVEIKRMKDWKNIK